MSIVVGIIPARYASGRFPGKPLAEIDGSSMIECVWKQCKAAHTLNEVIIATDDERIYEHVKAFGGKSVMTGHHPNGTLRCFDAYKKSGLQADAILNVQGDEPFIEPDVIDFLAKKIIEHPKAICTLYTQFDSTEDLNNPNRVKLVSTKSNRVLYFSRSPIPYTTAPSNSLHLFKKHIGLYAFPINLIDQIASLQMHPLEQQEKLEQLRWLFNDLQMRAFASPHQSGLSVDTPADLEKAIAFARKTNAAHG